MESSKATKLALSIIALGLVAFSVSTAAKGKPDKVLVCHVEVEAVLNDAGEPVINDDGLVEVVETYQSKLLPEPAIKAHINHGDHLIVVDDDGNLTACESLNDGEVTIDEVQSLLRSASAERERPATIADTIHPNIHQNNGR